MDSFADKPWFKYPVLAGLAAASAYVLVKPNKTAPYVAALAAVVTPIAVYFGSEAFKKWEPMTGSAPFMYENLIQIDIAALGSKLPQGIDLGKTTFYKGAESGKVFAKTEHDAPSGNYTVATWMVLA